MQKIINWYKSTLMNKPSSGLEVFFFVRIIFGIFLIFHGYSKILSPFNWMGPESNTPGLFQFLAALTEFGGGICIVLGILFPLVCFGVMCSMLVATFMHLLVFGDPIISLTARSAELAIMYIFVALFFLSRGPGRFSLDRVVFFSKS